MSRTGLRPHWSALRPAKSAIGSITNCAAMMHEDISAVPSSLFARASFWPTSGSSGALAKWNNMALKEKTIRGRHSKTVFQSELFRSGASASAPRARS